MKSRRTRWWLPVAVVGFTVAVAGVALVLLFVNRDEPGARSVDDALEDFRADHDGGEGSDGPPAGVYRLEGSGTEALSFPPLSQSDGETMPMTIGGTSNGCWSMRIDFNEAHWQDWQLCRDGTTIAESGGRTFQRWDLGATTIDNTSSFVCEPPVVFVDLGAPEGTTTQRSCAGTNEAVDGETVTAGTDTVVAHEELTIGTDRIEAVHIRSDQVASGAQTGSITNDFWFRRADGLPLRGERSSTIESNSPVGTITYTENGNWQLTSVEPAG
ncbi:MAG: hypothetical protein ACR2OH_06225 [Microthrixaceae bacterium]